ncbi:hypothetical protein CsNV_076 [Callinectes sapidus nudivirus]|nr:hypothetical protein CsNV_076 [Callinectes sapidus nudivirus]
MSSMVACIYFSDINGDMPKGTIDNLNIKKIYKYNEKKIIDYTPNQYNIGDILIGENTMVCVAYENISTMITLYNWGQYLLFLCDLMGWKNRQKIKIYTNNNNNLLKYTSIETLNSEVTYLLEPLTSILDNIELC